MKDSYDPHSDIGKPTTLEIGRLKSYSKRKGTCSFKGDLELWSTFKQTCAARGVSICHVLEALEEAWIQGQKAEATLVRPVIVNLTMQHVVERPRRIRKLEDILNEGGSKNWPPCCKFADAFWKGSREVGCLKVKDMVPLDRCWRCYLVRGFDDLSNGNEGVGP